MNTSDLFHTMLFGLIAYLIASFAMAKPLALMALLIAPVVATVLLPQLTVGLLVVGLAGYILKETD